MNPIPRTVVKNINFTLIGLAIGANLLFTNSSVAQEEGFRTRLHQQIYSQTNKGDIEAEIEFGRNIAARVLGRYPLYDNPELTRYVSLVGTQLSNLSSRPELTFHFAILDSDHINAYSTPGGYIFISRGAIKAMKDEAELAAVLAHEVAHISQRHIVKAANIKSRSRSGTDTMSNILGGSTNTARVAFGQAVDKAVETLFATGYQQADELEADRVATLLLASAGYDPLALKHYLERVEANHAQGNQELKTTHPPSAARMQALDKINKEEQFNKLSFNTHKTRFERHVKDLDK